MQRPSNEGLLFGRAAPREVRGAATRGPPRGYPATGVRYFRAQAAAGRLERDPPEIPDEPPEAGVRMKWQIEAMLEYLAAVGVDSLALVQWAMNRIGLPATTYLQCLIVPEDLARVWYDVQWVFDHVRPAGRPVALAWSDGSDGGA